MDINEIYERSLLVNRSLKDLATENRLSVLSTSLAFMLVAECPEKSASLNILGAFVSCVEVTLGELWKAREFAKELSK